MKNTYLCCCGRAFVPRIVSAGDGEPGWTITGCCGDALVFPTVAEAKAHLRWVRAYGRRERAIQKEKRLAALLSDVQSERIIAEGDMVAASQDIRDHFPRRL